MAGARYDRHSQRFPGRDNYSFEVLFSGLPGVGASHVIFGGQSRPVSTATGRGLDRRLGFPGRVRVIGRARVGGHSAVVLQVRAGRQAASRNSGHVVVVWNAGPAAYLVSVHLEGLPLERRVTTALELADSMRPALPRA